jgi:MFS family permease
VTEAYAWPITALVAGIAAGNAAAGALVEAADWRVSFLVGAVVAMVGGALVLARRRTLEPARA